MKVIEILNFNRELLKKFQSEGIRLEDARYIDLYFDYMEMYQRGEKVSYITAILSERYNVSVRTIHNVIKRFQRECKPFAL